MKHYCLLSASPFLGFGEGVGDTTLINLCGGVDDISSAPINLDIPFVFYQQQQTRAFVSSVLLMTMSSLVIIHYLYM